MPEDFDALFDKPPRAAPLPPHQVAPANGNPAYVQKAYDDEMAILAGTQEPGRNHQLNISALKLFGLVLGGHLDHDATWDALQDTGIRIGLTPTEVDATMRSAHTAAEPRVVPAPTVSAPPVTVMVDVATGEVIEPDDEARRIVLTAASDIKPARVIWLWEHRLAQGTLGLLAGREGLGKSTLAYWIAARVTRGELPGEHLGVAKAVLVCATEDSWEHTIVPRLIAADADLTKVYRVDVLVADAIHGSLSLPRDLVAMERHATQVGAALLLLDPLMSRLAENIDTHRDGPVRQALEPLVAVANKTGMGVLGIIHHNKSGSDDPLQVVMGSRAFTAVARSVHSVVRDPDDDTDKRRLFGTPKNNLGRDDLPTLCFTIEGFAVDTDDGPAWTGQVVWGEERAEGIADAMRRANMSQEDRSATSEAMEWLADYITSKAGVAPSGDVKKAGIAAGHSYDSLKRARSRLGYWAQRARDFQGGTFWGDPTLAERDPAQ